MKQLFLLCLRGNGASVPLALRSFFAIVSAGAVDARRVSGEYA
jgi:hypothetical protein